MLSNRRKGHVMAFTEYDRDLAIFIDEDGEAQFAGTVDRLGTLPWR